jgi:N-acetylglutamate synthase-like GNAT family acetyltransferase
MLQVRKIKPEDISFVLELASKNGCPVGKLLSNIEGFLICENDSVKCGCGCIISLGSKGFIGWVIVSEDYRRMKLGDAITRALLNIADLEGVKEVYAAGICGQFLEEMGFHKEADKKCITDIEEIFGFKYVSEYYKVSLEGYFKPCSRK